jgi:spore coat protein A
MMSRKVTLAAAVAAALTGSVQAAQSLQTPLAGSAIPQFVSQLPTLAVWPEPGNNSISTVVAGPAQLTFTMCEFDANMLPLGTPVTPAPPAGQAPTTKVWGYINNATCPTLAKDTYIGPVVVATRDQPTEIKYVNALGSTADTGVLAYKYGTDLTLHWADPLNTLAPLSPNDDPPMTGTNACNHWVDMYGAPPFGSHCAENYDGSIPAVPHLHGAEDPSVVDGGPDAWFTSDGAEHGHAYYSKDDNTTGNGSVALAAEASVPVSRAYEWLRCQS